MTTDSLHLQTPSPPVCAQWARQILGRVPLPDIRLVKRGGHVLAAWARSPGVSLAKACGSKAQAKAAYRFIANNQVTVKALQQAVYSEGAEQCAEHSRVFIAQDTTSLEYGHREPIQDLGPVTTSGAQGLLLHTSLALSQDGTPLGLLDQQIWTRPQRTPKAHKQRSIEDKESGKWLHGMRAAAAQLPEGSKPLFIFDREGDIHEVFAEAKNLSVDVVVRAAWNRRVKEPERYLLEAVRAAPLALTYSLTVPRRAGSHPTRETTMELRYAAVTLNPRHDKYPRREPLALNVVLVCEQTPPDGQEPLQWCLVTTEPVPDADTALAVAKAYTFRWRVEEFHLVLKSGCRIEAHQFESGQRIRKAVVLLSAVALFLLRLTYLARVQPDTLATEVLDPRGEEVLRVWAKATQGKPFTDPLTVGQAVTLLGRMGGHLGRKCDGPVGVRTLWRGWHDFQTMCHVAVLLE
jgi:hypothetical protein